MPANTNIAKDTQLGASVPAPIGSREQVVVLGDVLGNLVRTSDNGDGTSNLAVNTTTPPAANLYTEAAVDRHAASGTTGTFGWNNNVAAALVGIVVTLFAGGTNVVVSLQQQDANGQWQTIGSSATITANGSYAFSVGAGMTNGNVIAAGAQARLAWTLTGVFTGLTLQLGVQGR